MSSRDSRYHLLATCVFVINEDGRDQYENIQNLQDLFRNKIRYRDENQKQQTYRDDLPI